MGRESYVCVLDARTNMLDGYEIESLLILWGFVQGYKVWKFHGIDHMVK